MELNLGWQNFYQEIERPDEQINLAKAALFYARSEYPNLDIDKYFKFS